MRKSTILAASVLLANFALPAAAFEGHVKQCFKQELVPAQYARTLHLVRDAYEQIEYKGNHRAERVHYPAVYEERRTKTADSHYVLRPVACGK